MNLKETKKFIVYCHTNTINQKRYIGITCQEPSKRFRNGKGYKSSPHFASAIRLYGWGKFKTDILFENLSEQEAKDKEIELIEKYQTRDKNYGYNVTPGGEGYSGKDNPWFGRHHTEETKREMSAKRKGAAKSDEWKKKISKAEKGKIVSEETKEKMRKNHADVSGKNNPRYGCKLSDEMVTKLVNASKTKEAIEKMKKNKVWYSGSQNPNAKSVICIETNTIYPTIKEAAEDTNSCASKITDVCRGRRKATNNLHFRYMEVKENGREK